MSSLLKRDLPVMRDMNLAAHSGGFGWVCFLVGWMVLGPGHTGFKIRINEKDGSGILVYRFGNSVMIFFLSWDLPSIPSPSGLARTDPGNKARRWRSKK